MGFSADLDLSSRLSVERGSSNNGPCSNVRNYIQDKVALRSPEICPLASEDIKQIERKKEHQKFFDRVTVRRLGTLIT